MDRQRTLHDGSERTGALTSEPLRARLRRQVRARRSRFHLADVAIGVGAALGAVAIRYSLPLSPMQLPTVTVVVAVALVTTFVGIVAGATTAVVGGMLSWYVFFTPFSWDLSRAGVIPMIGFSVIATVIVTTSHLYRSSERRSHDAELAILKGRAEAADLFAREMAHRLKNALAIVQAIAFQTLDRESAETTKFADRLKALADAHDLLSEHVERPTARVRDVIDAALKPFADSGTRLRVEGAETRIAARQALTLALALHELGTNASKYGALSDGNGWVSLTVEDLGDRINLDWKEHEGPPVPAPAAEGFGTRLLRRLGMGTELLFEPDGVHISMFLRKA